MKLSTLTTDFQIVLDYLEENNETLYNEILSQLENNGKDKDSIRLVTITRLVLDYFPTDENFQKLFDYTPDELASILNAILTDRDSYIQIWNKINEITDLTAFEYSFPEPNYVSSVDGENFPEEVPTTVLGEGIESYELEDIWESNLFYFNEQNKIVEIFGVELANDMIADIYNWEDLSNDKKEKVYDYLTANPELVEELANKGNVVTQQQAMQQQIEEDEIEVIETKKNYTDAQIAKSMNITLDELFTLRTLKDNTPITFKTKYKVKDRKTKKITESNKGMFWHFSELFDKGYVGVRMPDGGGSSMKAKEFFKKTSVRLKKYEGPATDLSLVEPTEADLNKIRKFGKMVYQYTPGGYPSSGRYEIDRNLSEKFEKAVDGIKTREVVIKMTKAYYQIYGRFDVALKRKCFDLGCTDIEMEALENYTTRWEGATVSYRV